MTTSDTLDRLAKEPGRLLQGCGCRICGDTVLTSCSTCHGTGHLSASERARLRSAAEEEKE